MSNVTEWRAYFVIIHSIWNNALVLSIGAGTAGYYSIGIGCWGVCVGIGGIVCVFLLDCFYC